MHFAAGQVVYTGSSSMDVRLTLQQTHKARPSIIALFTFVARDPTTEKATRINPLIPQTSEQKQWFDERAQAAAARKAARKAAQASVGGKTNASGAAAGAELTESEKRTAWAENLLSEARLLNRMPGANSQLSEIDDIMYCD
jgi:hypothetical protein